MKKKPNWKPIPKEKFSVVCHGYTPKRKKPKIQAAECGHDNPEIEQVFWNETNEMIVLVRCGICGKRSWRTYWNILCQGF